MGHIGFTPQFKKKFKVEGDTKKNKKTLKRGYVNRKSRSLFNSARMFEF